MDGGFSPNCAAFETGDICCKPGLMGDLSWLALGDGLLMAVTMALRLRSRFKLPLCKESGDGI
jgi:hypothetical protein